MPVLGERLHQLQKTFGIKRTDLAAYLGFHPATITNWRIRDYEPDLQSVLKIARMLHLSVDWLVGLIDGPPWSKAILAAREKLWLQARELAEMDLPTPRHRLLEVWRRFSALVPDLDEKVWAWYIHWSLEDWEKCKNGQLAPDWVQLAGAAALTGIPERWLLDGDADYLKPLPQSVYERIGRVLRDNGLDPEDVVRIVRQNVNPRV